MFVEFHARPASKTTHMEPSWADCPRLDLTVYVFLRAIRGLAREDKSYVLRGAIGLV